VAAESPDLTNTGALLPGGPLCRDAAVKKHDPRLAVVISGLEDLQVIADYAVDESVFLGDPP
jgi:hypothetical protein